MALPETIRILGIPWRVEYVDMPHPDDPDIVSWRRWADSVIRIADWHPIPQQKRCLFGEILAIVWAPLIWGKADRSDEFNAIAAALFTTLRLNFGAVAAWFGWTGSGPRVADCTLTIHGIPVQIRRVPYIPGERSSTLGQSKMRDLLIMVRSDVTCPYRSAEIALHELMHATVQAVSEAGDMEEFVDPISTALAQVFLDNPQQMEWIFREGAPA